MESSTLAFLEILPLDTENDRINVRSYKNYNLHMPNSFWQATQETRETVVGGCGPGGFGDMLVPDTLWGLKVTLACAIHDWTFGVWNDKAGFDLANELFLKNMLAIIEQHGGNKLLQWARRRRAKKYYLAVCTKLGKSSYTNSHLKLM